MPQFLVSCMLVFFNLSLLAENRHAAHPPNTENQRPPEGITARDLEKRVRYLVNQLDDKDYGVRQAAHDTLREEMLSNPKTAKGTWEWLKKLQKEKNSEEKSSRISLILAGTDLSSGAGLLTQLLYSREAQKLKMRGREIASILPDATLNNFEEEAKKNLMAHGYEVVNDKDGSTILKKGDEYYSVYGFNERVRIIGLAEKVGDSYLDKSMAITPDMGSSKQWLAIHHSGGPLTIGPLRYQPSGGGNYDSSKVYLSPASLPEQQRDLVQRIWESGEKSVERGGAVDSTNISIEGVDTQGGKRP